ncbi:NUDIX hydrolase [Nocardioides anomalus]|uniref:NUDIX hydrolase n=1 Tax=Nocardioides anomalus TaxID=2712223 RepID=A0A6G6WHI6_9ACTN|nr:NUDIX hydrolase [Nocardioides anomalus]QIG44704.1 NUDIX hydrolase [Nocardioides anomalus]
MPSGHVREVVSAGAVVLGPQRQVLLVHRPKYDDWSFPKGKVDRGEHPTAAAVREVEEETGLRVRLGVPLGGQRYRIKAGAKRVHYWVGRATAGTDVGDYQPNDEIDEVAWFPYDKARRRLTYQFDVETLDEAIGQRPKTRTLAVLRHSRARSRKSWRHDDRDRPLLAEGAQQAARLAPVLAAYDLRRLVSSGSTRCVQTLAPYAEQRDLRVREEPDLSEEDATDDGVERLVRRLTERLEDRPAQAGGLVLCTHRPVLPSVFGALGLDDPGLAPGELVVVHLRRGDVRASERHLVG